MRILVTADPELPVPPSLYGGIERIVAGLVQGFADRGHSVGLVANSGSTASADTLFPWPGLRSRSRLDTIRNTAALLRAVRKFEPDIVHSFSRLWYLTPLLPSRLPKVMSYQRRPSARTVGWASRMARGTLDFTGCSEHICDIGRRAAGRWTAIHNFVDTSRFDFVPNVPADAPLVFLSRVEAIKGPHLAIEAARRSGRKLIIAGNYGATPADDEYWRTMVLPHVDGQQIEYVGTVNDQQKNELLGRAAALFVPIQWDEPFGIVFAEALACGTPVISCPRGALPEIVEEGRTGFLVENAGDLPTAIDRIGQLDRAACRKAAESRFSLESICARYLGFFSSTLER
ncbi:MAG TPA: glycosyltransferase [Pirellulales bacterium]|nr:glycosyltransferase [Pirellulales bacterium]